MISHKLKQDIFQHFLESERSFVEKILDLCQKVEDTYTYKLTTFLDPRQEEIVRMIANRFGLACYSSRQWIQTEYARIIIAPAYYECQIADFELVVFEIDYPQSYYQLTHAQILGTFLNRLSIRREFLGDIIIGEKGIFVFISQQFANVAEQEISKIATAPIRLVKQNLTTISVNQTDDGVGKILLLSSLRIDKLIAAGFSISRVTANQLIKKGKVRVNYQEVNQPSELIEVGHFISVRGLGRLGIQESLGFSKQGKIKLKVKIIKK